MNLLKNHCSLLINIFLLASKQIINEKMNKVYVIIEDNNHLKTSTSFVDFQMLKFLYIHASTVSFKLFLQNFFVQELLNAYRNDFFFNSYSIQHFIRVYANFI